jgi:hypothetical protein
MRPIRGNPLGRKRGDFYKNRTSSLPLKFTKGSISQPKGTQSISQFTICLDTLDPTNRPSANVS